MNRHSVHLEQTPNEAGIPCSLELLRQIEIVRGICNAVLSIRNECNIKVKTPLDELTIYSSENLDILEFVQIISEEVNVRQVNFSNNTASVGKRKAVLNLKSCGAKIGSRTREIMQEVNAGKWELLKNGNLLVSDIELEPEDFSIEFDLTADGSGSIKYSQVNFGIFSKIEQQVFVSLNILISQELQELSCVREIVRYIQQSRKRENLAIGATVNVLVRTGSERMLRIIENPAHKAYISSHTLSELSIKPVGKVENEQEMSVHEIEGFGTIEIAIMH